MKEDDADEKYLDQDVSFFGVQNNDLASVDMSNPTMLALRIKDFSEQANI